MSPPSKDTVLEGMKSLGQLLGDKLQNFAASKAEANASLSKLRAPLTKIVGNNEDIIKDRIHEIQKRPKLDKPTTILPPLKTPLAVFNQFFQAPYNFQWTYTAGDNGVAAASANEKTGSISASVAASNQHGTAAAAVGFQFQAPRSMLIYITPLITYNFNWLDLANFINASNSANFIIYVQVFEPDGRTQLPGLTFTYPLWNDDAGWLDEHSNSGTNVTLNVSPSFGVAEGGWYIFWFEFDTMCATGFSTFSNSSIEATLDYCVLYSPN
ncbi:hypothetical protein N431DRAFT_9939 [Stipitochalara longipes BDJ]|nr:hypothetical protein N431DRAFT_9939 [Stipitochalara longipes BDJ]